jgi:2'-5' RNA ligase
VDLHLAPNFDGQHDLHRLVRDYQAALAHLSQVNPIPAEPLHLTLQGVGLAAAVTADVVTAVVAAVRRQLADLTRATLTFTRPVVLPEAIALLPGPAEPGHEIRGAIRAGIADVWGADKVPEPDDGYHTHLSLGYVDAAGPAAPVIQAQERVEPQPASITIRTTSLLELHRDRRRYEWRTIEEVPLGR